MRKYLTIIHSTSRRALGFIGRPAAVATVTASAMHFGVPQISMWITGNPVVVPTWLTVSGTVVTVAVSEGVLWYAGSGNAEVEAAAVARELRNVAARAEQDAEYRAEVFAAAKKHGLSEDTMVGLLSDMAMANEENTKNARPAAAA